MAKVQKYAKETMPAEVMLLIVKLLTIRIVLV